MVKNCIRFRTRTILSNVYLVLPKFIIIKGLRVSRTDTITVEVSSLMNYSFNILFWRGECIIKKGGFNESNPRHFYIFFLRLYNISLRELFMNKNMNFPFWFRLSGYQSCSDTVGDATARVNDLKKKRTEKWETHISISFSASKLIQCAFK